MALRLARILEALELPRLADLGVFFRAVSPTPGTGIPQSIITAFSGTNGLLTIYNGATVTKGTRIYPVYARLIPTVAPASATRSELLAAVDSINRFSSGGSVLTPVNANMDSSSPSIATVNFGALTLAAESSAVRRIGRAQMRTAIPVLYEEYILDFLGMEEGTGPISGASGQRQVTPLYACGIGPGHTLVLHLWHPANAVTAASWEVELGWIEK